MRRVFGVVLAVAISAGTLPSGSPSSNSGGSLGSLNLNQLSSTPILPLEQQAYITCFKSGEQTAGLNKICYYNCMGSGVAITIKAIEICPLSIQQ